MPTLSQDIILDEDAFNTASADMEALKIRTENLQTKLEGMYESLKTALVTPAGEAVDLAAKKVLIQPIKDLSAVIKHVSETLNEIIGSGYYKDVFIEFEELNDSL